MKLIHFVNAIHFLLISLIVIIFNLLLNLIPPRQLIFTKRILGRLIKNIHWIPFSFEVLHYNSIFPLEQPLLLHPVLPLPLNNPLIRLQLPFLCLVLAPEGCVRGIESFQWVRSRYLLSAWGLQGGCEVGQCGCIGGVGYWLNLLVDHYCLIWASAIDETEFLPFCNVFITLKIDDWMCTFTSFCFRLEINLGLIIKSSILIMTQILGVFLLI